MILLRCSRQNQSWNAFDKVTCRRSTSRRGRTSARSISTDSPKDDYARGTPTRADLIQEFEEPCDP
jgi:hypothetical protein